MHRGWILHVVIGSYVPLGPTLVVGVISWAMLISYLPQLMLMRFVIIIIFDLSSSLSLICHHHCHHLWFDSSSVIDHCRHHLQFVVVVIFDSSLSSSICCHLRFVNIVDSIRRHRRVDLGLPLPGSHLCTPPFLHLGSLSHPHPSSKGRGRCSGVCISKCVEFEPTSLKGGEGLVSGWHVWLAANWGGEGEGNGSGERMKLNHDELMGDLKLWFPSKIALDVNAQPHDKIIKIYTILEVL